MWIICLDPVSASSEKGRGSGWAIRVGQKLPSRFGQSGAAREMNLVQIVVEAPAIRGVCQALNWHNLFLAGTARSVLVDYREGLTIRSAGYKLCSVEKMTCSWRSWKCSVPFGWSATFSWPLMSLWPARDMRLGRWLLVACFSSVKNHNVSGSHLFPSFTTCQKNPCATPRTVLQRAKKSLWDRSQFRS